MQRGVQATQLPSVGDPSIPGQVNDFERTYTTYGQEAAEAANAGARVSWLLRTAIPPKHSLPLTEVESWHTTSVLIIPRIDVGVQAGRQSWQGGPCIRHA